ncbi:MAG: hypothetical protein EB072_04980 [Betaproteobacteria bacterium]|nr:hypothetical protein [Betaproteobacteria bacterium]
MQNEEIEIVMISEVAKMLLRSRASIRNDIRCGRIPQPILLEAQTPSLAQSQHPRIFKRLRRMRAARKFAMNAPLRNTRPAVLTLQGEQIPVRPRVQDAIETPDVIPVLFAAIDPAACVPTYVSKYFAADGSKRSRQAGCAAAIQLHTLTVGGLRLVLDYVSKVIDAMTAGGRKPRDVVLDLGFRIVPKALFAKLTHAPGIASTPRLETPSSSARALVQPSAAGGKR